MKIVNCLVALSVFCPLQEPTLAIKKSYIVYLGAHTHGRDATLEDFERATDSHYELLGQFLESEEKARDAIFYSYTKHINGFAAVLEEEEANQISKDDRVVSVFENKLVRLQTTRSWEFLDMARRGAVRRSSIWAAARYGEDAIIGNIDTGVWPESRSFGDGGMGPVPKRWRGGCDNGTKGGVPCNRKLIGARQFSLGLEAVTGRKHPAAGSARDVDGHGTHTLSTAAGNMVKGASMFGYAKGTAAGGSPSARAAAYKVCWGDNCSSADILAGYDAAIHDGVDVISVSLGSNAVDYLSDPIALGSFHAVAEGVTVVAAAGNSGPYEATVSNVAPWLTTVGASTLDREFPSFLVLGNKRKIKGQSLSDKTLPANESYPLINSEDGKVSGATWSEAALCYYESLDRRKVKGKIVICLRGDNEKAEKGEEVIRAGGVGMVLVNSQYSEDTVSADPQRLPETSIGARGRDALYAYMNSTKSPVGTITAPTTRLGVKPAPAMTEFTSRGPNLVTPEILKPDVTAPGYNVLAAYTGAAGPTGTENDTRRVEYAILSGTSMSTPHVAGLAGLLKTIYPKWSPAAIRSAIMTTARTRDNNGTALSDYDGGRATPFAYGAGHIRPNRAMDPGLVLDLTVTDYSNYLCALGYNASAMVAFLKGPYRCPSKRISLVDLNYPSIAVPQLMNSTTVVRTVTNVGRPGTYKARVVAPIDISVSVEPSVLKFGKVGERKEFAVRLRSEEGSVGPGYGFGMIIWSDGKHYVRIPMAVNAVS